VNITNQYGTVNFDWKHYKKIMLSFSGGTDSALLLWLSLMELENKKDTTIQVFTGITPNKGKFKQLTSQEIFDFMRLKFFNVSDRVFDRIIMYNYTQDELRDEQIRLQDLGMFDLRIYALTSNPPYEIMEKYDLLRKRIEKRDIEKKKKMWVIDDVTHGPMYQPFVNVDKRWIAQCYHDFDLMDHIYSLTISCERPRETPDMLNSEEPCRHCWWCREKKMAFGTYDGGVV
jgi:hypothetical protein